MDNFAKYIAFRNQYKEFVYEDFSITRKDTEYEIRYFFRLDNKLFFEPVVQIPISGFVKKMEPCDEGLKNLVFHLGMIELISYWKAACPSVVRIKPYYLDPEQLEWWKKLYFKGLGEFLYVNSIKAGMDDFMQIVCETEKRPGRISFYPDDKVLVPVGGGKDSSVTLGLLSEKLSGKICSFALNARKAIMDVISRSGIPQGRIIGFRRILDPRLPELNAMGYLNGHTPFSALLAFTTLLAAYITGCSDIILSNESSADEATDAVSGANHQYSKSYEFEKDFRDYVSRYLNPGFNYFSFLRPLSELGISRIFSGMPRYFDVFRSCNAGSKTDSWCGKCPKCLFTAVILAPFLNEEGLMQIFGKNILNDKDLLFYFQQLTGEAPTKPFECVGTVGEVHIALKAAIRKYPENGTPFLLRYFSDRFYGRLNDIMEIETFLTTINPNHFLNEYYMKILDDANH